jgi:mRNA interferase MazF
MHRGEVWMLNLDPTIGAEIQKIRPVVIVSSDAVGILPLRVIVPLTDWKERYEAATWMVRVLQTAENGLSKESAADTFQIRSVSTARFVRKVGVLGEAELDLIVMAIGLVVEYKT